MSKELAAYVSIESTTIRRDFSFLGNLGKQGYGYNVDDLIRIFSDQLGMLYQVSQASKYFGADAVFEDIQFEIRNKEKIAIVGRNGCGKTTFLRCMSTC